MAVRDKLGKPLQESLLALLAYDDSRGGIVANMVLADYFEGDYADIAARCIDYHHQYRRAPGVHIDDVFSDVFTDRSDNRYVTYKRLLVDLMRVHQAGLNTEYLLDSIKKFVRLQSWKRVLLDASQRISSREEHALEEVEEIVYDILKIKDQTTSPGMKLTEVDRLLTYLEHQHDEFRTGIPQLDKNRITPARGTVMMLVGAKGTGKSWWMVHLGKAAMLCRQKILHVTLEMSEEQVTQRYVQSLFSASIRDARTMITEIELDNKERFRSLRPNKEMIAEFVLRQRDPGDSLPREELEARVALLGGKLDKLLIKRFPSGTLTVRELTAHLDMLELTHRFVPDIILLDYLGLMKIDKEDYRHSLGRNLVDLRAVAIERNIAMCPAQQSSRAGASARMVDATHVAEDWSLVNTSDTVLTLSASKAERALGLARLFVSRARDERDGFGLVLTQNYAMGQFMLQSMPLIDSAGYEEELARASRGDQDEGEDDGDDDA